MATISVRFDCENADTFIRQVENFARATKKDIFEAFTIQTRLLCKELIDRTPPFSGKTVEKMLLAQGKSLSFRAAEIADQDMSAKQVGERRVEKDIRRVIYGVQGAAKPANRPIVAIGQAHPGNAGYDPNGVEFGVRQKCEGRDAVRIFATKTGEVYGVDMERFKPNATMDELAQVHESHRTKRGRVTTAGSKDKIVGRWRWLEILITSKKAADAYIAKKKKAVGQGKGGWAKGFADLGGRISSSGWVGRHWKAGDCSIRNENGQIEIILTNRSKWASGGDDQRIIEKSLERRAENMKEFCEGVIANKWEGK